MKNKNSTYTLIALVLGALCGALLGDYVKYISFIGTIYINLLKFLIGPIIFTSIAATAFKSSKNNSTLVIKAVIIFAIMFVATFLLTSAIVTVVKPASGFVLDNADTGWQSGNSLSITEIIVNLFPSNIVSMFANNSLFAIIMFSYLFGFCLTKIEKGTQVAEIITALRDAFYKILQYLMLLTPAAVFALISNTVAQYGAIIFSTGIRYILTAYLSGILTLILIMILPVLIISRMKPLEFIRKISRIWTITVTTCSSAATLPTTMQLCKEDLGIPEEITDVVVPLGCTIHMCGGAVSFALLGLFVSAMHGVEVSAFKYVLMLISALLINMSAPGIPNGGVVIGAMYLEMLGLPSYFTLFYSGIYKILDMLYTTLNVTGDITANVIINSISKKKS
ncbi:MAG: dicarboxylate/amino acid:cation symporter [Erysipelotrichaceae bacterium]|nr:dicarboxylate/amino acid:cation symporter [Erysipelotrichaceae bacterium]